MKLQLVTHVKIYLAYLSFFFAIIFAGWGFICPPQGEISGGVLILIGQLFVLIATVLGLNLKINAMQGEAETHVKQEE